MKINNIILYILVAILGFSAVSCRDEFEYYGGGISDEATIVNMTVDFSPMSEGLTRSAYNGDVISDIQDLSLVLFDMEGVYHSHKPIDLSKAKISEELRGNDHASGGKLAGETMTKRVTFSCDLPIGTYYIYAVANLRKYDSEGNVLMTTQEYLNQLFTSDVDDVPTRQDFCELHRSWDESLISNNSEMTGYVVNTDKDGKYKDISAPPSTPEQYDITGNPIIPGDRNPVTVMEGQNSLHCWLRRMASKVTVSFDASKMSDNISVYIHDIRLCDTAKSSPLLCANFPQSKDSITNSASQRILYCPAEDEDKDFNLCNYEDNWPVLTLAHPTFDKSDCVKFPQVKELLNGSTEADFHSNSAKALFFYENMQGRGESKLQDADGEVNGDGDKDGIVDSPLSGVENEDHYKDNKPYGTYIEVRAYYVCKIRGEESQGPIIYRFMLGKNTIDDYNAERNYHYKLTLQFLGRANEVDWHIEYDKKVEDIGLSNPYYISYGYNQSLDFPIKVKGHVTKVVATIIENNWFPTEINDKEEIIPQEWQMQVFNNNDNKTYAVPSGFTAEGVEKFYYHDFDKNQDVEINPVTSLGFLSLLQPKQDAIGMHISEPFTQHTEDQQRYLLYYYFKGINDGQDDYPGGPLWQRTYDLESYSENSDIEDDKGSWRYERLNNGNEEYTQLYLPLYTRERNLVKTTGHSGQNPFVTYQRNAKVKYDIYTNDSMDDKPKYSETVDIIQVPRVANPTGIWRSWNNSRPFHVALNMLDGEDNDTFKTIESNGGWSAEVVVGSEWVLLNGGRQKIYGPSRSKVEFDYRPAGVVSSPNATRFGIIEIRYHNYSCIHRIFVRQGYSPIMINETGPYWRTFNLETQTKEGRSPLDEGSLFRFGNLEDPIASSNNYNDKTPWINVRPQNFKDFADIQFVMANDNSLKFWKDIIYKKHDQPFMDNNSVQLDDKTNARMMTLDDIKKLRDNGDNAFAFGILYGDEASSTLFNVNEVFGYKGYLSHQQYGMRGCFVYNMYTGAQIFFPIGSSGYGQRYNYVRLAKDFASSWGTGARESKAVLKYAGSGQYNGHFNNALYKNGLMFYTLFRSQGAVYWTFQEEEGGVAGNDNEALGLDLNYFTYDFNPINWANLYSGSDNASNACFIRLVQDQAPE